MQKSAFSAILSAVFCQNPPKNPHFPFGTRFVTLLVTRLVANDVSGLYSFSELRERSYSPQDAVLKIVKHLKILYYEQDYWN